MMRIRLSPVARADLDELWLYIARESGDENTATRAVEAIAAKFALFARFPLIGRRFAETRHAEVRVFPVGRHVVFYRPAEAEIRILRVLHSSRDAFAEFLRQ